MQRVEQLFTGTLAATLGANNPFRYRGYYYDTETGLYYLQTRYYDPEVCRFISADVYVSTGQGIVGNNMYAYCGNNPVTRLDDGGRFWNLVIGAVVGGVIAGVVTAVTSYAETGSVNWGQVAVSTAAGAITGAIAASGLGILAQAAITAGVSMVENGTNQVIENKGFNNFDTKDVIVAGVVGAAASVAGSLIGRTTSVAKAAQKQINYAARRVSHGAVKRGAQILAKAAPIINRSKGITSLIGTGVSTLASITKNVARMLGR